MIRKIRQIFLNLKSQFEFSSFKVKLSFFLLGLVGVSAIFMIRNFLIESQNALLLKGSTVQWIKKEIVADELSLVAQKKIPKSGRAPAFAGLTGPLDMGPRFVTEPGADGRPVKKLRIKLNFLCSSWLYMLTSFGSESDVPENISNKMCRDLAIASTAVTQLIFDNSKIPVKFVADLGQPSLISYKLDALHYPVMMNKDYLAEDFAPAISRADSPAFNYQNNVNSNFSKDRAQIMPAVDVPDFRGSMFKIPGVTTTGSPDQVVVDKTVRISIPSTFYSYISPHITCRNPDSLVRLNNFEKTFGLSLPVFDAIRETVNGVVMKACGQCGGSAFNTLNEVTQSCTPQCICIARANGGEGAWNSNFGANCDHVMGPYPGVPQDLSNYNECGYLLKNVAGSAPTSTPDKWHPITETPWLSHTFFEAEPMTATMDWVMNSKIKDDYVAKKDEYSILVMARPFSQTLSDGSIRGYSVALPNMFERSVVVFRDPVKPIVKPLPLPGEYFNNYGVVIINADASFLPQVLAHEIGHLLGGYHETSAADDSLSVNILKRDYLKNKKLGAYQNFDSRPGYSFQTIMGSLVQQQVLYFSTRSFKAKEGYNLGIDEDNRQHITKFISYLAGENLETVPSHEQQMGAQGIINDLILNIDQQTGGQ